ncbi:MAG: hypothetical protein G01um101416_176 [Microgenomates group bacterium Gr01-1014_16]|nr:MAG: hypothetical protein G01um101416_176 [Microgenomates group bacterium Gr01-1014_16]
MNGQTNLSRVQIYMEPDRLMMLDLISNRIKINRSQIIRDLTKPIALAYGKVVDFMTSTPKGKNPLLKLSGIEKSKTGHISENVDEIYLHD